MVAATCAMAISTNASIRGALVEETYAAFRSWDFGNSKTTNFKTFRHEKSIPVSSENWLNKVIGAISRRFDPNGRDRPLVELAQAGCDRTVWIPLLLWHMTREEFLLRDFLIHWLYPQYLKGAYRVDTQEVVPYLRALAKRQRLTWTDTTTRRVASGLLHTAAAFGLLIGRGCKEFTTYHLPEESFVYLLHAMAETESNARRITHSPDWHLYLMEATDVERELLRLHQFRQLHYEVAGSLAQLKLPQLSVADYARQLVA